MFEKTFRYIDQKNLINPKDKLLVAVSGGIDSVVMLHLISRLDNEKAVAHCNFQLRGKDALEDQEFVKLLAENYKYLFHTVNFDTEEYAKKHKLSIQMAARQLRYNWFEEIANEFHYTKILIAHNKNDVAETMLINLSRGTGIRGLSGISVSNSKVIRPLIFAERKEIEEHAKIHKLDFREDTSNAETKYTRNKIRHKILPVFKELNPSFLDNFSHTAEILTEIEKVYSIHIQVLRQKIFNVNNEIIYIKLDEVRKLSPVVFFNVIADYNFTFDSVEKLFRILDEQPGKIFYSKTHQLLKDRIQITISPIKKIDDSKYIIEENNGSIKVPINLIISDIIMSTDYRIPTNQKYAVVDYHKLKFPLMLRKWKDGDYFFPLGMRGKKKLSDFFVDQKISVIEKKKIWLLCSENDIVWIVGYRIDDRYKITPDTKKIYQLKLID